MEGFAAFLYVLAFFEDAARGDAEKPFGVAGEVGLIVEARLARDGGDGELATQQEPLRQLDALAQDVLVGAQAGGPLEEAREMVGADVGRGGDLSEREVAREVLVDVV